jgi:hypothetical protein
MFHIFIPKKFVEKSKIIIAQFIKNQPTTPKDGKQKVKKSEFEQQD